MKVLRRDRLQIHWEKRGRASSRPNFQAWFAEVQHTHWKTPDSALSTYLGGSVINKTTMRFDIAGTGYHVAMRMNGRFGVAIIDAVGTHREVSRPKPTFDDTEPMPIKPIRSKVDYNRAVRRVSEIIDAKPRTPEGDELAVLSTLIDDYEARAFPIEYPDPVEAILYRMEEQGLERKDLEPYIGNKSRISQILNRQRTLSIEMIRKLHRGLDIPLEVLID